MAWWFLSAPIVWVALLLLAAPTALAQNTDYEVWIIDQADAANDGNKLYIFSSAIADEPRPGPRPARLPEVVDLQAAAQGVGDGPGVRPHILSFNSTHSHAVIAYLVSRHVQVIRAVDRKVVASIDVGEQAHAAVPAPDDSFILVSNQDGKRLARIRADFAREQFSYNSAEDFDLGRLTTTEQHNEFCRAPS
jgi:DNA-binding beta-propeller fold protein YncE